MKKFDVTCIELDLKEILSLKTFKKKIYWVLVKRLGEVLTSPI